MIGTDQFSGLYQDPNDLHRYYERMAMKQQNAMGSLLGMQASQAQMQRAVPATPQEPHNNPVLLLTGDDE